MDELFQFDEEENEEYEIEYGATNIINRNKMEKLEIEQNLQNIETMFKSYKMTYGKYNRKIKKINMQILRGKEEFDVMKEDKKLILKEMNYLIQVVSKDEEPNKILEEKRRVYQELLDDYFTLDIKLSAQEHVVTEFKSEVHALNDLILDAINKINEINQKIYFSEMEITRKKQELINSATILKAKGDKLLGEEISKEKMQSLTVQTKLLNIEIRTKTSDIEKLRALHIQAMSQLETHEYHLQNKKNELATLEKESYIECKKEIDITMSMEMLNKKMLQIRMEILEMEILTEDTVTKLTSLQNKLNEMVQSWQVLVVQMSQETQVVEVLTVFMKRVGAEKFKTEAGIPILVKQRDDMDAMINEMSNLKLND